MTPQELSTYLRGVESTWLCLRTENSTAVALPTNNLIVSIYNETVYLSYPGDPSGWSCTVPQLLDAIKEAS